MVTWNNIEAVLPMENYPVFIAKEKGSNLLDAELGRLLTGDTGQKGWFISNNCGVVRLSDFMFWAYLEDKDITMPDVCDDQLLPTLEDLYSKLSIFEIKFQCIAKHSMLSGNGLYHLDYFVCGILNRSISLLHGFQLLMRSSSFLAASHLVRPHLDNYLRLSAAHYVNAPHDFAMRIWKGESIRNITGKDNKKLTDKYLKEKAIETYPWMGPVYEATSGFIHFSQKHIMNATKLNSNQSSFNTYIGRGDIDVTNEERINAVACMIEISNSIALMIYGWIETKRIKG